MTTDTEPRNRVYAYPCPDPGCLLPPRQPCRTRNGRPHPLRLEAARTMRLRDALDLVAVKRQIRDENTALERMAAAVAKARDEWDEPEQLQPWQRTWDPPGWGDTEGHGQ